MMKKRNMNSILKGENKVGGKRPLLQMDLQTRLSLFSLIIRVFSLPIIHANDGPMICFMEPCLPHSGRRWACFVTPISGRSST